MVGTDLFLPNYLMDLGVMENYQRSTKRLHDESKIEYRYVNRSQYRSYYLRD